METTLEKSLCSVMKLDNISNDSIIKSNEKQSLKSSTYKDENYQKGEPTEMLTSSLDQITIDDKNNFMTQAGKIISNMLEARLALNNNNLPTGGKVITAPSSTMNLKPKLVAKQKMKIEDRVNKSENKIENSPKSSNLTSVGVHPMKNIIDICDSEDSNTNSLSKKVPFEIRKPKIASKINNNIIDKAALVSEIASQAAAIAASTTNKDDLTMLGQKVTKSPFLNRKQFNKDSKATSTPTIKTEKVIILPLSSPKTLLQSDSLNNSRINNDNSDNSMNSLESETAVIHRQNKKCNRNDSRRLSTQAFDRRSYIEKDNQLINAINETLAVATSFQQQLDEQEKSKLQNNKNNNNNNDSNISNNKFVNNSTKSSAIPETKTTKPQAISAISSPNKTDGSNGIGNKVNGNNSIKTNTGNSTDSLDSLDRILKQTILNGRRIGVKENELQKDDENKIDTKGMKIYDGKEPPICCDCNKEIKRGPFITALGRIWCPEHFMCVNGSCRRPLQDIGFVEEKGDLYCEFCFEKYLAPTCSKCNGKIKGDCLNAIGKHFHPECFNCSYCGKIFGNTPFFLEDGEPYCEADWNELFTTKCFACGFPIEAGDRWVEALNHNYHSQCFNCSMCKKNLEGTSFFNKGGRPFCKNHAR